MNSIFLHGEGGGGGGEGVPISGFFGVKTCKVPKDHACKVFIKIQFNQKI